MRRHHAQLVRWMWGQATDKQGALASTHSSIGWVECSLYDIRVGMGFAGCNHIRMRFKGQIFRLKHR